MFVAILRQPSPPVLENAANLCLMNCLCSERLIMRVEPFSIPQGDN